MNAFTLRLEPALTKKLDKICHERGFSKTGLIKSLIRNFIEKQDKLPTTNGKASGLEALVGIVRLGGDAVQDAEDVFE